MKAKSETTAEPKKPAPPKKRAGTTARETVAVKSPSVDERIRAFGPDKIIEMITDGCSTATISAAVKIGQASLINWIALDPEYSARAREARIHAAKVWDEQAERVLHDAADPFELAKARELAQHYRWRASKAAPRDYGDKVTQEHTGAGGGPIQARVAVEFVRPALRDEDADS